MGWAPSFYLLKIYASSESWKISKVDTDPKGRFRSSKVSSSNESSLFVPLQGIAHQRPAGYEALFEALQNYMQIKVKEMKTK